MSSKSDTGDPTDYDDADTAAMEAAADDAWADYESSGGSGSPSKMKVSAQVEWNGVTDRARGGHRTTTLVGLEGAPIGKAVERARAANQRAESAGPSTSYRAKGWHAQISALTGSKHGSAAADRAGLNPSARTVREWLSETRAPSKANQEKIAEAYNALRNRRAETVTERAKSANRSLADTISSVIRGAYNSEVRLRDITRLEFED